MKITVLVVDDAAWSAITLEALLGTLPNVDIMRAGSGLEAWSVMQERPISALITDLHMPGMDGFELIQRVRATAPVAAVPIIVISADGAPETQDRARRLGADTFFVKPYSPAAVREKLEQLLHV